MAQPRPLDEREAAAGFRSLLDRDLLRTVGQDAGTPGPGICRRCSAHAKAINAPLQRPRHAAGSSSGRDAVNQSLYLWSKTVLPGYILTMLGDRMEMAHSIEGRVPFLDHHVVEVIRSQPVNQKIHGMTEKYVLREAARDVITDTVYRRQKHPFLSPPATLNPEEKLSTLRQRHPARTHSRLHSLFRSEKCH